MTKPLPARPQTQSPAAVATKAAAPPAAKPADDPVLCGHCGRTASNGLPCIGMCVADSGY